MKNSVKQTSKWAPFFGTSWPEKGFGYDHNCKIRFLASARLSRHKDSLMFIVFSFAYFTFKQVKHC